MMLRIKCSLNFKILIMKIVLYLKVLLSIGVICCAMTSSAQNQPSQKQQESTEVLKRNQQRNYYRKSLSLDSAKAEQVSRIQYSYKQELQTIIADTSLNEKSRRARIQVAIEIKNQHLQQLLNPAQQAKIIPTTERKPSPLDKKP